MYYLPGLASFKSSRFYDSQQAFESALKIVDPNSEIQRAMLFNLGSANFKLSRFTAAKDNFTEALRLDESHVKSLIRRAECHFKLKEFEDCIVDCEEVLRLKPSEVVQKLMNDAKFSVSVSKGCNAYTILDVKSKASKAEIKKAFHKLSLMYHSDKNPKATAVEKKKLERKFLEAQKAYNFAMSLSN